MKILLVEDSPRMARSITKGLSEECFSVDVEPEGHGGLHMASTGEYDLVLLDVNLPGLDGFSLVRELRKKRSDVPVIMVTARDGVEDRIEGLDGGADDYLTKPFAFEELLARVRAVMRRPGARAQPILSYNGIELDPAQGRATRNGRSLGLSAREFALLRVLMANMDRVMSRSRLFEAVWESDYDGVSNVLDVYINYLRNKLEEAGDERVIHTLRGRGYILGNEP